MKQTMSMNDMFLPMTERARQGDVTAMVKLAQCFREKLPQKYLALEVCEGKNAAECAAAILQYRKDFPSDYSNAQACAMWYIRAWVYGSQEAETFLFAHPGVNRLFQRLVDMLMVDTDVARGFSGKSLRQMGLLHFSEDREYSISPLSKEGFFIAQSYSGYEGPDEDGFGMEEQYNYDCYDEFFNLLGSLHAYSHAEYETAQERFLKGCREKQAAFAEQREAFWNSNLVPQNACRYKTSLTQRREPLICGSRLVHYFGEQKTYIIPEKVTIIGENAFSGNSDLECITVPNHVAEIEYGAFSDCPALKKLTFPDSLETLGDSLCSNSRALQEVHLPHNLRVIPANMFEFNTSLKTINLPPNLKEIRMRAFLYCPIEKVTFPEGITNIADSAFVGSKIKKLSVPGTAVLGESAFQRSDALTEVILVNGITEIPQQCFANCGELKFVHLPETLERIDCFAFANDKNLMELRLPLSVNYISYRVFPASTTLRGAEGSYVEGFARKSGLRFLADNSNLKGDSLRL